MSYFVVLKNPNNYEGGTLEVNRPKFMDNDGGLKVALIVPNTNKVYFIYNAIKNPNIFRGYEYDVFDRETVTLSEIMSYYRI